MPNINWGGHVLLTEAIKETASHNRDRSVNTTIFRGGHIPKNRLS